ncbi:type II secretion system F family protein [Leifsonia xyli]|uniref:type II secretion system F family protein n=1 Tax=Leifsonia xyli TaxID=1575 RepID=UPI003D668274
MPGAEADAVAALTESIAVLLDAGLTPRSAWSAVAAESRRAAGGSGADARAEAIARAVAVAVVASLEAQPSCAHALLATAETEEVRAIAATWRVAEASGAPLGHALGVVAETLRDIAEAEREADVALSSPRATTRLVTWLPLAGAVLAAALGADVVGAVGSTPGAVALGSGTALLLAGRWWMRALVRRSLARRPIAGFPEELVAIALSGGSSAEAAVVAAKSAAREAGLPPLDERGVRRVLRLAESAGAPAVELLTASARQQRRSARAEARRQAAVLGVRLMLPLGACVLPSFLLLAVAPLALSLLSSTTAGLR